MAKHAIDQVSEDHKPVVRRNTFETVTVNVFGEIVERQPCVAEEFVENLGGGVTLEMVVIPSGRFLMGSCAGVGYDDECPQHSVRIPAFLVGKYTVTQEQWAAVMTWAPPYRCAGARHPVDRVSWNDGQEFCRRLSKKLGRSYRLPSEAEWEYACRAGSATPFCYGETIITQLANYVGEYSFRSEPKGVYRHGTTEVGSFPANAFGIYDMHGNVWEWCADSWHDNYAGAPGDGSAWQGRTGAERVLRGGCWHDPPNLCRSAARLRSAAHEGEDFFGFRVALTLLLPATSG